MQQFYQTDSIERPLVCAQESEIFPAPSRAEFSTRKFQSRCECQPVSTTCRKQRHFISNFIHFTIDSVQFGARKKNRRFLSSARMLFSSETATFEARLEPKITVQKGTCWRVVSKLLSLLLGRRSKVHVPFRYGV